MNDGIASRHRAGHVRLRTKIVTECQIEGPNLMPCDLQLGVSRAADLASGAGKKDGCHPPILIGCLALLPSISIGMTLPALPHPGLAS